MQVPGRLLVSAAGHGVQLATAATMLVVMWRPSCDCLAHSMHGSPDSLFLLLFLFFLSFFLLFCFPFFLFMARVWGLVLEPQSSAAAAAAWGDQQAAGPSSAAARCSRQLSSISHRWTAAAEVLLTSAWRHAKMISMREAASPKAACMQPRCTR